MRLCKGSVTMMEAGIEYVLHRTDSMLFFELSVEYFANSSKVDELCICQRSSSMLRRIAFQCCYLCTSKGWIELDWGSKDDSNPEFLFSSQNLWVAVLKILNLNVEPQWCLINPNMYDHFTCYFFIVHGPRSVVLHLSLYIFCKIAANHETCCTDLRFWPRFWRLISLQTSFYPRVVFSSTSLVSHTRRLLLPFAQFPFTIQIVSLKWVFCMPHME